MRAKYKEHMCSLFIKAMDDFERDEENHLDRIHILCETLFHG